MEQSLGGILKIEDLVFSTSELKPVNGQFLASELDAMTWADVADSFIFEESSGKCTAKDSDAGIYYDFSIDCLCKGVQLTHLYNGRQCILRITDTNGKQWVAGYRGPLTLTKLYYMPNKLNAGQRTQISFEGKSLYPFLPVV